MVLPGLALGLLATPIAAHAQTPFSVVEISLTGEHNLARGNLADRWEPGLGLGARLAFPFDAGWAAVSYSVAAFRAASPELPDFDSATLAAEWNARVGPPDGLRAYGGLGVGVFTMAFPQEVAREKQVEEAELTLGGQAGVAVALFRGLGMEAAVVHRRVFTHHAIRLTALRLGVSYTRAVPDGLVDLLR